MIQVDTRQKTARAAGAVGGNAGLPRYVESIVGPGWRVLDFGCGPAQLHVQRLRESTGAQVVGYDLNMPWPRGHFDLVYASNVLNVQPNIHHLNSTLSELHYHQGEGRLVVNYPSDPRKAGLSLRDLIKHIEFLGSWSEIKRLPESETGTSTPIFELIKESV